MWHRNRTGAESPFYETLEFTACELFENAESQELTVVRYQQIVSRKSAGKVFHDQTGYWMWDSATQVVMQSLTIPRAVCALAGSGAREQDGKITLEVHTAMNDSNWGVIQSPFMRDNTRIVSFSHTLTVGNNTISYRETTVLDIYGIKIDHTDAKSFNARIEQEIENETTLAPICDRIQFHSGPRRCRPSGPATES